MEEQLESRFPEDWRKEFDGLSGDELSNALSEHRTDLSTSRSHMANERTHLAYLRTSLSLMTFGVTLNRFSIYLRENKTEPRGMTILYQTEFVGLGMVFLGVGILLWALRRYQHVSHQIETDTYTSSQSSVKILTIAILLLGGSSAIWMTVNQFPGD